MRRSSLWLRKIALWEGSSPYRILPTFSPPPEVALDRFAQVVGEVLRNARADRGLTLRQVARMSDGRFKPSVVGGYERAERRVTLARFYQLATFYGVPADRLLARALARLGAPEPEKTVLDLHSLERLAEPPVQTLSRFVREVKSERGDPAEDVITLRAGDLEAIAQASGVEVAQLLSGLRPAIRTSRGPDSGAKGNPGPVAAP